MPLMIHSPWNPPRASQGGACDVCGGAAEHQPAESGLGSPVFGLSRSAPWKWDQMSPVWVGRGRLLSKPSLESVSDAVQYQLVHGDASLHQPPLVSSLHQVLCFSAK